MGRHRIHGSRLPGSGTTPAGRRHVQDELTSCGIEALLSALAIKATHLTRPRRLLQPFSWIDQTFIHPPSPEETGEADVPEAAKK